MKVLFIIQGEGRGHLTQAIALAQMLRSTGSEIVGVMVGKSEHRRIPDFFREKIKSTVEEFESPNILPAAKSNKVSFGASLLYNIRKLPAYAESIRFIKRRIRECEADLVVNFYEVLTGLSYALCPPGIPLVCVAHQYIFLHPDYRFPPGSRGAVFFLKLFTRLTAAGASRKLALSLRPESATATDSSDGSDTTLKVVPPLLRKEVFGIASHKGDYLHGYVLNPGFRRELETWHNDHQNEKFHLFWDRPAENGTDANFRLHPLDDQLFLQYMAGCKGFITTAGFESVCEALYFGKPVFMVPTHIEQRCNAFDANAFGAGIYSDRFDLEGFSEFTLHYTANPSFRTWVERTRGIILHEIHAACEEHREKPFRRGRIPFPRLS